MDIQPFIDAFDQDMYRAIIHYNLRHNNITPAAWEKCFCKSTASKWINGNTLLADGVNKKLKACISLKTRKCSPEIRKRVQSRDFILNPTYFHKGGKAFSEMDLDNLHAVNGRSSIPNLDEQRSSPEEIGKAAMYRYYEFADASLKKFKCESVVDVVIVHGDSCCKKNYLIRTMFFEHKLNPIISWEDVTYNGGKTKYKGKRERVIGYDINGPHIARNGNLGRQQTCMLRFYRKSEALYVNDTSVPIPKSDKFNIVKEQKIMAANEKKSDDLDNLLYEQNYAPILLS